MGKTLYLECNSGISGDMLVGALIDLGADVDNLKNVLSSLSEKRTRTGRNAENTLRNARTKC